MRILFNILTLCIIIIFVQSAADFSNQADWGGVCATGKAQGPIDFPC